MGKGIKAFGNSTFVTVVSFVFKIFQTMFQV